MTPYSDTVTSLLLPVTLFHNPKGVTETKETGILDPSTYPLQVQLLLDPPLAVCGDVKLEFSSKLKLDMFAIKPKFMQPKKEFHFW